MAYRIYVGSYSNEISTLSFDPDAASLSLVSTVKVGHHPSWVTSHPTEPSVIFTGLEQADGKIIAVKFDKEGHGSVVAVLSSGGKDPCTLLAAGDSLIVGNYSSGTVSTTSVLHDAPYIASSNGDVLTYTGSGPNKERQEASHPHQVIIHPDRGELLVPDLGSDKLRRLAKVDNTWVPKGELSYPSGGGPRHVAFYKDVLYTLLELKSEITAHKFPPLPEEPTLLDTVPTMKSFPGPIAELNMLAAEILIPTPNSTFSTPYLYVSNRNDPSPEGDAISIYSVADPEKIVPVVEIRSGLNHLRGMVFGGPDNKFLVAGGANGGGVKVFERIDGGKGLKEIAHVDLENPTAFLWA